MNRLEGKVCIITGAGSGIGRATALLFGREGARVVSADLDPDSAQATAAEITEAGGVAVAERVDVTSEDQAAELARRVAERFERIDVLFNNAGANAPGVPMEDLTYDQWSAVVGVNLTGSFLCAQEGIRIMKAQDPRGGRIINNGSISAHTPRPNSAPYTATKHAITGLTKSVALDGRAFDIACGQIDIGNAQTDLTARMTMGRGVPQADGRLAPEPVMDVKAVADAVLMMANLPLSANVPFLTVMATKMPYIGRG